MVIRDWGDDVLAWTNPNTSRKQKGGRT